MAGLPVAGLAVAGFAAGAFLDRLAAFFFGLFLAAFLAAGFLPAFFFGLFFAVFLAAFFLAIALVAPSLAAP